jgi:magnesium-transporting ATPase (P-type)
LPERDVIEALGTSDAGLTEDEVGRRRRQFGPKVLATRQVTAVGVLTRQLRNPLLVLLMAAAGLSALTGDGIDGSIITTIVILSVGLCFANEYRSELAVAAVHASISHRSTVTRDAEPWAVDVKDLVASRPAPDITTPRPSDERDLELAGYLTFVDKPKADAGASIGELRRLGIDVKIITGDIGIVAAQVCATSASRCRTSSVSRRRHQPCRCPAFGGCVDRWRLTEVERPAQ